MIKIPHNIIYVSVILMVYMKTMKFIHRSKCYCNDCPYGRAVSFTQSNIVLLVLESVLDLRASRTLIVSLVQFWIDTDR